MAGKRIVIFGASGTAGGFLTRQCLEQGMVVTAFTRKPGFGLEAQNLKVHRGAINDEDDLRNALTAQDAIVSSLGSRDLEAPTTLVSGWLESVLPIAGDLGIRRVVIVGGAGILQADETTMVYELPSYPSVFKYVNQDMLRVYSILLQGDMDWTMLCCPRIVESEAAGDFLIEDDRMPDGGEPAIEAGNIGRFVAEELVENAHVGRRVGICSAG